MPTVEIADAVRTLVPSGMAFVVGILLTPMLTHYLYKYQAWKKTSGKIALDGTPAVEFNRLHEENERRAPRMGGIVIWGSVSVVVLFLSVLASLAPESAFSQFNFLSRSQTWIPFATLLLGAFVGLIDDLLVIRPGGVGVPLRFRLLIVVALSTAIGWWFYDKLDVSVVNIPFASPLEIGFLIVPLFVLVSLALYASGIIDGIDGLSGGVFASVFASYAVIAFVQQQIDLAALCATVVGGLLAFLWFNIPPARFYMTDTGTMGLTLTIAVVAFMTDSLGGGVGIFALPIIGFLLVITVATSIIQVAWKKWFGKKLFRITPLHHHFEAIGWPGYKVTMRYWILSAVCAFMGVIVALMAL
ncbi:MAG TPA: hypothetical protein VJH33_00570 [Candidatus Paceibacterota bacterium]